MAAAELRFPSGFWWGAATAAHQVEGGLANDWIDFEHTPGTVKNGDTSEVGVDHYRRFEEDFDLAREMAHNVHRLSIEWSRIEPERGQLSAEAIAHYHEVFAALRARGLEPLVTLHHFTNPVWIADQGGWLVPRTADDFARFAGFAAAEFPEVRWWVTINEPNIYAFHAYMFGAWPPRRRNPHAMLTALATMALGHQKAYAAMHEVRPEVQVGLAYHIYLVDPFHAASPLDRRLAAFVDHIANRAYLEAVTTGQLDFALPGKRIRQDLGADSALDFLGINYYTRGRSRFPFPALVTPGVAVNDLGWEIYAEGLYRALGLADGFTRLRDGRRIPIVITENGIDDRRGDRRNAYLVSHLQQVARAIHEGIDVRGYVHWTLMDNFEWAQGYAPRFGLYRIDREHGLARVPTETVEVFERIASSNALAEDLIERYGSSAARSRA